MTPWLYIVGLGADGLAGLGDTAKNMLAQADILIGGERHLKMVAEDGRPRLIWPKPFRPLVQEIAQHRGHNVCVLASGDPCCHGVGNVLARHFDITEMRIVPAPSAYSLACSRLAWDLPDVDTISLHGRALATLHPYVQPGARLLLLSEDGGTPDAVAVLLAQRGFGSSVLTVFENMGGPDERSITASANDWQQSTCAALNTIAVHCLAENDAPIRATTPGLPDEAFHHDGQLTKREVRAITLSGLSPGPGQLLWDVGAGCGSVAIEWMRGARNARAIAVEKHAGRRQFIADNALALGTPSLQLVAASAPECLADLDKPDAIFVGGGASNPLLLETCWKALPAGGRLVANGVSLQAEQTLNQFQTAVGGELTRIAICRAGPIGQYTAWRPLIPVTQLTVRKRV